MSVVGTAEVLVTPLSTGFGTKLESQVASSGFAGKLEKQFANAGILSGNAFSQKIKGAFQLAGFGSAGLGLGLAVTAGVVVGLSKIGASFGAARNQIIKETGATTAQVAGLFDTVKRASLGVPASLGDIATAVDLLFRRGVPLGAQLDKLAKQELFLAKITKTDLGANVEQTTALFAKFNVPLSDQSRELDVLFKAAQASGKSFTELTSSLFTGAAALQQFGFNLDSSTALIAGLTRAGVNVGPALAGLRAGFGRIAKEGGDPVKVLQALLVEFDKAPNSTKAAADAIKLFGGRAGAELVAALKSGRFSVSALLKTITDGKGGILATGAATLTLSDRFKLLRNRVEESLSGAGAAVRRVFSTIVTDASGPVSALVESFVHLGQTLGPALAPIGLLLVGTFKAALPIISDLAVGIDTIASVLGHVPGPVLAGVSALGLLVAGLAALKLALVTDAIVSFVADLNPVVAAVVVTAAALTALGAVMRAFKQPADTTAKSVRAIQSAMFDTGNTAGIFGGQIKTAGEGFAAFLKGSEGNARVLPVVKTLLKEAGSNTTQLGVALNAGGRSWVAYSRAVTAAAVASGGFTKDRAAATIASIKSRFDAAAISGLHYAVVSKQITQAQLDNLVATDRNADGTVNYARVLNDANGIVALAASRAQLAADKQNAHATSVAATKISYLDLATAIGRSAISEADAETALQGLGFTAAGAKDEFKRLQDGIKNFVDTAHAQLPTVGTAVSAFHDQLTSDASQFQQDLDQQAALRERLNTQIATGAQSLQKSLNAINIKIGIDQAAIANGSVLTTNTLDADLRRRSQILQTGAVNGGQASASLAADIAKNNEAIHKDFQKLIDDNDPAKFTKQLLTQAVQIATFTTNLRTLIREGFAPLAAQLSTLGPEAAGGLAAGLASDPAKAAVANAASSLLGQVTKDADAFNRRLGATAVTGAETATAGVGKKVADAIVTELTRQFPQLRAAGQEIQGALVAGIVGPGIVPALSTHIPEIHRFGADAADAARNGITSTLSARPPAFSILGLTGGHDYSTGVAKGITENGSLAVAAAAKVAQDVVAVQRGQWRISSPSKVAAELGAQYGGGLAAGLSTSGALVRSAATDLAAQTISATEGIGVNIASSIRHGLSGALPTKADLAPFSAASQKSLADFVAFASGVVDNLHKAFTATTVDVGQVQNILDELTRQGTTEAATFGQTLVDKLLQARLLIPRVAPAQPSSEQLNAAVAQSLPVGSPAQRGDAQAQQAAAEASARGRGVFEGATIQFPEKADPVHIAAALAWKFLT